MRKKGKYTAVIRRVRNGVRRFLGKNPLPQRTPANVPMVNAPQYKHCEFFTEKQSLKELKVAAVMDRFTLECFRHECQLVELTPNNWKEEMTSFQPDMLFIESAWEGKDKLWYGKINHCAAEVHDLTEYCREKNIPVVFWNKEDPVFTDTFIPVAKRADFVFTTDLECVEKYKAELDHDRVFHLHFAAQPAVHNPIEKYDRKDRFCFAGAYYHRYQDRCRVFDAFSDYFIESRGLDIYDRNYLNARPEHKFPERYDPYILGRLDPSEIDIAYKGYVYGINMNSITQSQTMFARRVFELIASNTIVVGNYSRGVKNYFGDLTFCTDDEKTLRSNLERYCSDNNAADKLRLLALRKVLSQHLVEDRLDDIVRKVFNRNLKRALPMVTVYSRVETQEAADRMISLFRNQTHSEKQLLLVSDEELTVPGDIRVMTTGDFCNAAALELCGQGYLACFSADDWYGSNYLTDMVLSLRYGDFAIIGKAEYFTAEAGNPTRIRNKQAYRRVSRLTGRRCMVSAQLLRGLSGEDLTADRVWSHEKGISIDAMNYCEFWSQDQCADAEDLTVADQGIPLEQMELEAERITPWIVEGKTIRVGTDIISKMRIKNPKLVWVEWKNSLLQLVSELPEGTHDYLYLRKTYDIAEYLENGSLNILFRVESRMNIMGVCRFDDKNGNKLDAQTFKVNARVQIVPPEDAAIMKIAYRISGPGTALLQSIELGTKVANRQRGGCFLSRSNVLVLTNHYPAPDDLYRNMFVHNRIAAYKEQGALVDVMRMNPYTRDNLREFEGINVIEGQKDMLVTMLADGSIDTVCVHFLSEDMWDVLRNYLHKIRLIVWLHGADIQPWWRRAFLYHTEDALEKAKKASEARMALWQSVFEASKDADIQFVFVSQFFCDQVLEDYRVDLPKEKLHIIHNCIDTEQFNYVPKKAEDRLKLLSIRPYASSIYANDLTVKAILELVDEPWFPELDISIYGRGPLFEEVLAPLRNYPNIHIEETFLTHSEIADIHKNHGVFLTPSRMDTQGVSRDEAMASGLVPITTNVAAIPEFTDENCAIVVPAEDYKAIADGIRFLYHNPEEFVRMSENAAKRVRSQTSSEFTIRKEMQLIFGN